MWKPYFFLVGALASSWGSMRGMEPPGEVGAAMQAALEIHGGDPTSLRNAGMEMLERHRGGEDCDSLLVAEFLISHASLLVGNLELPVDMEGRDCPLMGGPLWYAFGHRAYVQGLLDSAQFCFKMALEQSHPYGLRVAREASQSLGAVSMQLYDYATAMMAFETAANLKGIEHLPNGMNNLAYTNLVLGQCKTALEWSMLAEKRLKEMAANRQLHEEYTGFSNALGLTRLQILMAMGDTVGAAGVFDGILLAREFAGRELAAVGVLTSYCLWLNDFERFQLIRPRLQTFVDRSDVVEVEAAVGASCLLFAPWSQGNVELEWNRLKSVPSFLHGVTPGSCAFSASSLGSSGGPSLWKWGVIPAALLFIWAVVLAVRQRARWRVIREVRASGPLEWERWLDAWFLEEGLGSGKKTPLRVITALDCTLSRIAERTLVHLPGWELCTPLERQMAVGLAQGDATKKVSRRMGITASYAYNLRSRLRTNLRVPDGVSLDRWLQSQSLSQ